MAGLERNQLRTRETFLTAVQAALEHPEITNQIELARFFGWSTPRTLSRRLKDLDIKWNSLADWKDRQRRARAAPPTPQPSRWTICHVIVAPTLEEAIARFRAEVNPSIEIVSIQRS